VVEFCGAKALRHWSLCGGSALINPTCECEGARDERSFLDYATNTSLGERGVQVKFLRYVTSPKG